MGSGFSDCCATEALTLDGKKQKSEEYNMLAKAKAFESDDDLNSCDEGHNHTDTRHYHTDTECIHNLKAPAGQLKIENTTSNQISNAMRLIKRKRMKMNKISPCKSAPSRGAFEIQRSIDKIKHENDLFIKKYGSYFSSTNTSSTNITTTTDDEFAIDPEFDEDDKTETHPLNHTEMPLEIEDSYDLPVHDVIDTSIYDDQLDVEDMALINAVAACDPNVILTPPHGPIVVQPQPYKNTAAIFSNGISDESLLSINSAYSNHGYGGYTQRTTRYHYPPKGPVIRPMNGPATGPNVSADSIGNGNKSSYRSPTSLSGKSVSYTNNNEYENDEDCHNVSGCKAIKRIIRALKWYSMSGSYIDNDKAQQMREEILLQKILSNGYDKHILTDYQHILNHHLIQCVNGNIYNDNNGKTEYELICDEINKQIEPCDIKRCIGYKRFQDIVKKDLTQCDDRQFVIDFMDLIHCYLMHNQFL